MARLQIRLSDEQVERLLEIAFLDAKVLSRLIAALEERSDILRPSQLRAAVGNVAGLDGSRVIATLLYWSGFARQNGLQERALIDNLERVLNARGVAEGRLEKWREQKQNFLKLISLPGIYQSAKSLDLGYDFPRFSVGARILTDLRPTFNRNDKDIVGFVICQTLRVDYVEPQGRRSISIAMDSEDIIRLRDACNRALEKAEHAVTLVDEKLQKQAFVNGQEHYDVG